MGDDAAPFDNAVEHLAKMTVRSSQSCGHLLEPLPLN